MHLGVNRGGGIAANERLETSGFARSGICLWLRLVASYNVNCDMRDLTIGALSVGAVSGDDHVRQGHRDDLVREKGVTNRVRGRTDTALSRVGAPGIS